RLGGEAVSFLTFTGPVLGEATKAALLRKRVTLVTAAQALVVDNLLYNLSVALFILSGSCVMLAAYKVPRPVFYALLVIAISAFLTLFGVVFALSRRVMPASALIKWLIVKGFKRRALLARREHILRVEGHFYHFYRHRRGAFFWIVALDLISHASSVFEVYITLHLLGLQPALAAPFVIESLTKVINFVFGFVPGTIGVYESGNVLILRTLGILRRRGRREASVGAEVMVRAAGTRGLSGSQPFTLPVARAAQLQRIAGVRATAAIGQTYDKTETGMGNRIIDGINFDEYAAV